MIDNVQLYINPQKPLFCGRGEISYFCIKLVSVHYCKQRTSAEHIAQWFQTTEIQQLKQTTYIISSEPVKVLIITPLKGQRYYFHSNLLQDFICFFAECIILMHHRKQFIKKQEGMEGRQSRGGTPLQAGKPNKLLFALQHDLKAATKFRDPFCKVYRTLNRHFVAS